MQCNVSSQFLSQEKIPGTDLPDLAVQKDKGICAGLELEVATNVGGDEELHEQTP
jgi:hypothetical protein